MPLKHFFERAESWRYGVRDFLRVKARDAKNALWLRTHGFKRVNLGKPEKIQVPDVHGKSRVETPAVMWLRKPIASPDSWQVVNHIGSAYLFATPGGKEYFLKSVGTRTNPGARGFTGTESVKNLVNMLKAGVKTESPVGLLMTMEGNDYLIAKAKPGYTFQDALLHASQAQRKEIAASIARQLAKMHNSGFAHGHLHGGNIIVHSNMARIIDPTLVTSKKEPWSAKYFEASQKRDFANVKGMLSNFDDSLATEFERIYKRLRK